MMKNKPMLLLTASLCAGLLILFFAVFVSSFKKGVSVGLGDTTILSPPPAGGIGGGGPVSDGPDASAYSNEQVHELLQRQSEDLGIRSLTARSEHEAPPPQGFLGPRLGSPEGKRQAETAIRQLAALRRGFDVQKKPSVPIVGETAQLLAEPSQGGEAVEKDEPLAAPAPGPSSASAPDRWSGPYGAGMPGTFTVSENKSWSELWRNISSQQPPPAVDFTRSRVAAVFLGHRPTGGYGVEIASTTAAGPSAVVVRYREVEPVPGHTPPTGATAPYAMRVIPKSDLPVRFEKVP